MSSYILDYDVKKKVGVIKSTNLDLLRDAFSVEDPGIKFAKTRSNLAFLPSRKYAITPTGRFEPGLCLEILKKITQLDPESTIQVTDLLKKCIQPGISIEDIELVEPLTLQLRDYQRQVVSTAIKKGRGISIIATAGGKTLIMSTLISTLKQITDFNKVVVIAPTQLVRQTYQEFLKFSKNWSCTWWTGEHSPDKSCDVIVVGTKILLSKKQDINWLLDADILIIDEVHSLRYGNTINKTIKKFSTFKKFGYTGTLPESILDQWTIKGLIGPVIYEKSSYDLRFQQYIAQARIQTLHIKYKNPPNYSIEYRVANRYLSEINFLIKNKFRNKVIHKLANKCNNNILILVDRIEHGEELLKTINLNTHKKVFFIKGEVESDRREQVKRMMEHRSDVICIAISSIFSTGINIKNLHYILFAAGGKAKIRIIQSIGRGLRLHEGKKQLIIYDLFDDLKYGCKHYERRKILYEKERIPQETIEIQEP